MKFKITMIGAGSIGFSTAVAQELIDSAILKDSAFVLMDIDSQRLKESECHIQEMIKKAHSTIQVTATTNRQKALVDADLVITSFAPHRMEFWAKDIEIARRRGVELLQGENGGPAGQIHALRNISILMEIVEDIKKLCPDAWLLNFTNPMSMLCTYLYKYTPIKSMGFCHQTHGSFGVIAEMLGFEPGDLRVITAGINHLTFLLDIQKIDSGKSFMEEFRLRVCQSPYWQKKQENIPEQLFTLEFFKTFGVYPVGYDSHICEYIPFFYSPEEWLRLGYQPTVDVIKKLEIYRSSSDGGKKTGTINDMEPERILGGGLFPFPKNPAGEYYRETPVKFMETLISGTPTYFDSMILLNKGCISNLPSDAVVDMPGLLVGGKPRGIELGELPFCAAEICRRQIAVHERLVKAAVEGDRQILLESMCLDPFVHNLNTARQLVDDYLTEYKEYLPQFFEK